MPGQGHCGGLYFGHDGQFVPWLTPLMLPFLLGAVSRRRGLRG